MQWFGRGARAALLLLLCAGFASCDGPAPPASRMPPAAPEPVAPRGAASLPFTFTWKRVPGGDWIYRVTVVDGAERVLFENDVKATSCPPSQELTDMMSGRGEYSWRVSIIGADGRPRVTSAPVRFRLQ